MDDMPIILNVDAQEEKILEWAKSVVYGEKAKSDDECQTK